MPSVTPSKISDKRYAELGKFARECLQTAVQTFRTMEPEDHGIQYSRETLREHLELYLDEIMPMKKSLSKGAFVSFLRSAQENFRCKSHPQNVIAAANTFFPLAALNLAEDSVPSEKIAGFCLQAAIDVLEVNGTSYDDAVKQAITMLTSQLKSLD